MLRKLWYWLCNKNEKSKKKPWTPFVYSEMIKYYPIHGSVGDDDIIMLSHKLENGEYETCYVTIKQLKAAIVDH